MEIALVSAMFTYAGGLGVLAGDMLRSAADLEVSMVAVALLHRQGYFSQHLDAHGRQTEAPVHWAVDDSFTPLVPQVPRPGDWPPGTDPRLALSGAEMVLGLGGVHM